MLNITNYKTISFSIFSFFLLFGCLCRLNTILMIMDAHHSSRLVTVGFDSTFVDRASEPSRYYYYYYLTIKRELLSDEVAMYSRCVIIHVGEWVLLETKVSKYQDYS